MNTIIAMFGFAVATSITPGPNNMMLLMSGANFGLSRSVPHIAGISLGFPVMILAIGLGLGAVFETYPLLHTILKYVAFAYLVYLAVKLARAGRPAIGGTDEEARPMGFLAAAAFQWVNPKAWVMAISATALYVPLHANPIPAVSSLVGLFVIAAFPSCVIWCLFGTAIARFLGTDKRVAVFNTLMAVLLVLSMVPTLF